jgi:hypothetical protein
VREEFRKLGHDAVSCDLLPSAIPGPHIIGDLLGVLYGRHRREQRWDMLIAFPPCTYLCVSGLHWNKRRPERAEQTEQALEFVEKLLNADVERIALENPVGCISSRIRPPDQIIQPHEFGDDASKKTCLWLKKLPPLLPTCIPSGTGRVVKGRERWANQTDSGQNKLAPSPDRGAQRSITYPGIGRAMAQQWGGANAT